MPGRRRRRRPPLLAAIDDPASHRALVAERAFLEAALGGELLAAGRPAWARPSGPAARLRLDGMLASGDGRVVLRAPAQPATDPEALGRGVGGVTCSTSAGGSSSTGGTPPGAAPAAGRAVTVYLVGAGPGDPGLLTRRGAGCWPGPTSSSTTGWSTRRCWPGAARAPR